MRPEGNVNTDELNIVFMLPALKQNEIIVLSEEIQTYAIQKETS